MMITNDMSPRCGFLLNVDVDAYEFKSGVFSSTTRMSI